MAELNIPAEVKDIKAFPQVDKTARQIIAYAVLMGAKNQDAFLRFHPEYAVSIGKGKYRISKTGEQDCKNFWSYGKNRDYREQYEQELAEFLGRKQTSQSSEFDELSEEDKAEAVKMFRGKVYKAMRTVDETNIAALTDVGGLAKSTKVLNENEEQEIRPIRVLPARCSECRYKAFVESTVLEGLAIDCCAYCKARKVAENAGYRFKDGKDLLDIPENVAKALERKNDVQLTDILSGKIKN